MSTITILLSTLVGIGAGLTGIFAGMEWWQILIFLLVYAVFQIGGEILIKYLKNKNIISEEEAKELSEKLEEVLEKIDEEQEEDTTKEE